MPRLKNFTFFYCLFLVSAAATGVPTLFAQTWQTIFGGEQVNGMQPKECPEDLPASINRAADGGLVVIAHQNQCGDRPFTNYGGIWIAKLDRNGTPLWLRYPRRQTPDDYEGEAAYLSSDGLTRFLVETPRGFVGTGRRSISERMTLVYFDLEGRIQREQFYSGTDFCDGSVCGKTNPNAWYLKRVPQGIRALIVVKGDGGDAYFTTTFGSDEKPRGTRQITGWEYHPSAFTWLRDGGFLAVPGEQPENDPRGVLVERFDARAGRAWQARVRAPGFDPTGLMEFANGDLAVTGYVKKSGGTRAAVARLNAEGTTLWFKEYAVEGLIADTLETPEGGLLAPVQPGEGPLDILKIKADGTQEWVKTLRGRVLGYNSMVATDTGYALLCYTKGAPAWYIDIQVIHMDRAGNTSPKAERRLFPAS